MYLAPGYVLSDTRINPTTVFPWVEWKWFGSWIIPNHNYQFILHHDDKPWESFLYCKFFVRMKQHYYRQKPSAFQSYYRAIYPKTEQMNAEKLEIFRYRTAGNFVAFQWRHNGRDGVSNHQRPIVCSTFCSGADQRKHQSSASLAFVRGIPWGSVDSPQKGPATR